MVISTVLWSLSGFLYQFFGASNWTPESFYKYLLFRGWSTFGVDIFAKNNSMNADPSIGNVAVAMFALIVNLSFQMQIIFTLSIFTISSLTIWIAVKNVVKVELEKNCDTMTMHIATETILKKTKRISNLNQFHENLEELIILTNGINRAWKYLSFWLIIDVAIWFSKDLDAGIKADNFSLTLYLLCFMTYLSIGVIFSAESSRNVTNTLFFMKKN